MVVDDDNQKSSAGGKGTKRPAADKTPASVSAHSSVCSFLINLLQTTKSKKSSAKRAKLDDFSAFHEDTFLTAGKSIYFYFIMQEC